MEVVALFTTADGIALLYGAGGGLLFGIGLGWALGRFSSRNARTR